MATLLKRMPEKLAVFEPAFPIQKVVVLVVKVVPSSLTVSALLLTGKLVVAASAEPSGEMPIQRIRTIHINFFISYSSKKKVRFNEPYVVSKGNEKTM